MTTQTHDATYNPEDNKLRLYPAYRLPEAEYQRLKEAGFKWAPKQELFVAPRWTCAREDLLTEMCGEIGPDFFTMADRAAAKAERLDALADKRARQATAYSQAANELSRVFENGQPILVGHHSERKARKTQERMHSTMDKAAKAADAVGYWQYRAEGVEWHADRKNRPGVRARRIKTLLAELRDLERGNHDAAKRLKAWEALDPTAENFAEKVNQYAANGLTYGLKNGSFYWKLEQGEISPEEVHRLNLEFWSRNFRGPNRQRWITHTLHRLDYERGELGAIKRYEDDLTAAVLQTFARTMGADKPKAEKKGEGWAVSSPVPLPLHMTAGENAESIELHADKWRDLMQSCGYEHTPPRKSKKAACPLLNLDADELASENEYHRGTIIPYKVIRCTKAEFQRVPSDYRGTRLSICKRYRFRVALGRYFDQGGKHGHDRLAIFLTDSKAHPLPAQEEAAA